MIRLAPPPELLPKPVHFIIPIDPRTHHTLLAYYMLHISHFRLQISGVAPKIYMAELTLLFLFTLQAKLFLKHEGYYLQI